MTAPHFVIESYPQTVQGYPTCGASVKVTVKNDGDMYGCFTVRLISPYNNVWERTACAGIGQSITVIVNFRIPSYSDTPYNYTLEVLNEYTNQVDDQKSIQVVTKKPGDTPPHYDLVSVTITPENPKVGQVFAVSAQVKNTSSSYSKNGAMLDIEFQGQYTQVKVYPCPEGEASGGASYKVDKPGTYTIKVTMYNLDDTSQPPQTQQVTFTVEGEGGSEEGGTSGSGGASTALASEVQGTVVSTLMLVLIIVIVLGAVRLVLGGSSWTLYY